MSRWFPWIMVAFAAVTLVWGMALADQPPRQPFDLASFGRVPVMHQGRPKPLDTVARATLHRLQGKQSGIVVDGKRLSPEAWLLTALTDPAKTDATPIFRIDTAEIQDLLGTAGHAKNMFSYNDLMANREQFANALDAALRIEKDARSYYQVKLIELETNLEAYESVMASGVDPGRAVDPRNAIEAPWVREKPDSAMEPDVLAQYTLPGPTPASIRVRMAADRKGIDRAMELVNRWRAATSQPATTFADLSATPRFVRKSPFREGTVLTIFDLPAAPEAGGSSCFIVVMSAPPNDWVFEATGADASMDAVRRALQPLVSSLRPPAIIPAAPEKPDGLWRLADDPSLAGPSLRSAAAWRGMLDAWKKQDSATFNASVASARDIAAAAVPSDAMRATVEASYQRAAPFFWASWVYVLPLILALLSWVAWSEPLRRAAIGIILFTLVIHTVGIVLRIYITDRPPITNLYTTAIFIGWACVVCGLVLEVIFKRGIGAAVASLIGFLTLIIGWNLSDADTFEPLQAVLATNFWLATHVVIVNLGYASTFLAGTLASIYIIRGVLTPSLDKPTSDVFNRAIYGMVAFGIIASFIGTVLGGIWADHSWGRFWGWDPKENGALMVVLWNALVLHARWGGLVRRQGVAVLASLGSIITAWSWFGVNLLGKGLHAYGFIEGGRKWLTIYVAIQLLIAALGCLPAPLWLSFRSMHATPQPPTPKPSASAPQSASPKPA